VGGIVISAYYSAPYAQASFSSDTGFPTARLNGANEPRASWNSAMAFADLALLLSALAQLTNAVVAVLKLFRRSRE
jgi:hypothetical protein